MLLDTSENSLISAEELTVELNKYFSTTISMDSLVKLRKSGKIPAKDIRKAGTFKARWKYNFIDVKEAFLTMKA